MLNIKKYLKSTFNMQYFLCIFDNIAIYTHIYFISLCLFSFLESISWDIIILLSFILIFSLAKFENNDLI